MPRSVLHVWGKGGRMKIIPLALLLTLLLSPSIAFAEWVFKLQVHKKSGTLADTYIDSEFKKDGNTVYVWFLSDFVESTDNSEKAGTSRTSRNEYDCGAMRMRHVARYNWAGPMGTGTPTREVPDLKWIHASPGSNVYIHMQLRCSEAGL